MGKRFNVDLSRRGFARGIGNIVTLGTNVGGAGDATGDFLTGKSASDALGPKKADTSGLDAMQARALELSAQQQGVLDALSPSQATFGQQLANQALGQGPSLADAQMRAAQDRNLAQQLAAAKSMRSPNAGLQSRNLANQGMVQGQQTAQAAAQARLAEQQQNQNAFGNYLASQQDYNTNLLSGANKSAADRYAANAAAAQSSNAFNGQMLGTAAMAAAMMFSDKKLKKNIKPYTAKKDVKSPKYDGTKVAKSEPKKLFMGGMAGGSGGGSSGGGMDMGSMIGMGGDIGKMLGGGGSKQAALDPNDIFGSYIRSQGGVPSSSVNPQDMAAMANMFKKPSENSNIMSAQLDNNILQQQMGNGFGGQNFMMAAHGGKVPGKASVAGDSEKNDTVHALLSPDEVVVPRTVAQAGPEVSGKFVQEASSNPKFDSKKFLDSLQAYTYEYKDPKHGQGKQTSVMAQDLEKTPEGKSMVVETPQGKAVDYGRGYGMILAAQADLNKRMAEIESKKAKPAKKEKA